MNPILVAQAYRRRAEHWRCAAYQPSITADENAITTCERKARKWDRQALEIEAGLLRDRYRI